MRSRSKQKGSAFERYVCKELSKWVTSSDREDIFWRSAMSGGRATLIGKKADAQLGDISAINHLGQPLLAKFFIECKFYKDLNFDSFLYSNTGELAKIVEDNYYRATDNSRVLMLVFKENRRDAMVLFSDTIKIADNELIEHVEVYKAYMKNPFRLYKFDSLIYSDYNKFISKFV